MNQPQTHQFSKKCNRVTFCKPDLPCPVQSSEARRPPTLATRSHSKCLLRMHVSLADEIGASCELSRNTMSTLVNRKINISLQNVRQVLLKFPDLSPDWLIMGVGSMLRNGSVEPQAGTSGVNLAVENRYLAEKVSLLESIISNKDALLRRDEEYIELLKRGLERN